MATSFRTIRVRLYPGSRERAPRSCAHLASGQSHSLPPPFAAGGMLVRSVDRARGYANCKRCPDPHRSSRCARVARRGRRSGRRGRRLPRRGTRLARRGTRLPRRCARVARGGRRSGRRGRRLPRRCARLARRGTRLPRRCVRVARRGRRSGRRGRRLPRRCARLARRGTRLPRRCARKAGRETRTQAGNGAPSGASVRRIQARRGLRPALIPSSRSRAAPDRGNRSDS
jgi:hypothetical protein